jgi:chaperone required for assembly of F1-ATPase
MTAADDSSPADPVGLARRLSAPPKPKRFYKHAEAVLEDGVYVLRLDGKRAMSPGRNAIAVADQRVAEAIAGEWAKQVDVIDPSSMPVTRLVNSAVDGVSVRMAEVRDSVFAYAATDLLYYRAGEPEGLVARQREAWDPLLAWAERRFSGRFILAEGVMHVAQPERTLAAIRREISQHEDALTLAGLHLATTLSGSALIALALAAGEISVDEAWAAAHVDEDWNISQWGEDAEAMHRRARRFEDFKAAALALTTQPGASC